MLELAAVAAAVAALPILALLTWNALRPGDPPPPAPETASAEIPLPPPAVGTAEAVRSFRESLSTPVRTMGPKTGLHGVVTQTVARRRREIGIRVAIGATPSHVLRLVLARTLLLLACGAVAGAALAVVAGGVLSTIVYGASLRDPLILGGVAAGLVLVGTISCWAPIRKALSLDHSQLTSSN